MRRAVLRGVLAGAVAAGVLSAPAVATASPRRPAVAPPACTVSAPMVTVNPIRSTGGRAGVDRWVAFTYTKDNVWYGYAYDRLQHVYDVISWQHGLAAPRVLHTFRFTAASDYSAQAELNVRVVGVTPAGAVIAAVVRTTQTERGDLGYDGWAFLDGKSYKLRTGARWENAEPISVESDGTILGLGGSLRPKTIVTWASKQADPASHDELFNDDGAAFLVATDRGDLVDNEGVTPVVHYAGQSTEHLLADDRPNYEPLVTLASGMRVYGHSENGRVAVWDLTHPVAGDVRPAAYPTPRGPWNIIAAGLRGQFVTIDVTHGGAAMYWTLAGAHALLPALAGKVGASGVAVDRVGRASITRLTDGLPHLLTCS